VNKEDYTEAYLNSLPSCLAVCRGYSYHYVPRILLMVNVRCHGSPYDLATVVHAPIGYSPSYHHLKIKNNLQTIFSTLTLTKTPLQP